MNRSAQILMRMATAVACSLMTLTSIAQDDQCGILKNGVFDESSKTVEISQQYASYDWICSEEIKTSNDVDSKSAELGVPVEGVAVSLGWKKHEQSFSAWKQSYCKAKSVSSSYLAMQAQFTKHASQILVDGFLTCIHSPGVHVWRSPASAEEAAFSAKFLPLEADRSSASLKVESSRGVTCNPSELTLTQATRHIHCVRDVIKPQVVYFSSEVFNVVPGTFTLPGPPAVVHPVQPCNDVPTGPIPVSFTKFKPGRRDLGPYCVPVTVSLQASGQARRNSTGPASSIIALYSTETPSKKSFICSKGVTLLGNEIGEIQVSCSDTIPAHRAKTFSVHVTDSSADTYNLHLTLDVKPMDGERGL